MKKSLIIALSLTTLLAACGEEKTQDKGATKIESSNASNDTTNTKNSETKNSSEKKIVTKSSAKQSGATDIMTSSFHSMYMRNDHRFAVDKIKFGMTKDEVEAIYGPSLGKGNDLYGLKTSALYDVYAVNYDNQNKVRQIVINPKKKITKSEFLKIYANPSSELDYPGNTLEYNDNDNNGFKIRAAFDDNDNLIGLAQVNDAKGMQESSDDTAIDTEMQDKFKSAMFNYAEDKGKAITGRYLNHGSGIPTDLFTNTEDGLILLQTMLNPGADVHDIIAEAGVIMYDAKDGTTGEHKAANDPSTAEGIGGMMTSDSDTTIYLLANNGKVYEYHFKGNKGLGYFALYTESWGFESDMMPEFKETTDPEIKKIASEVLAGKSVSKPTSKSKENKTKTKSQYSFIDENGKIDIKDPAFKQYFFHEAHTEDFAGIKVGMTREEVEALYGPVEKNQGYDMHQGGLDRVGDISLAMGQDDRVGAIYITPGVEMTDAEFNKVFGEPTEIVNDDLLGPVKIYNTNKNNGFQIVIGNAGGTVPIFINRAEGQYFN
ncbi:hypothetical protein MHJ97_04015 [Macrococcus epidermidis]|uniref:hypothetical protein n=1 Tax=Macrococcus epidermidis TaxID=1902580 RepID=UPI001EF2B98D|nr:hypothetical protein [Macrococcus epidermidis]MCG7419598.1 hypothetical protein [Macrococcus epidermidis]